MRRFPTWLAVVLCLSLSLTLGLAFDPIYPSWGSAAARPLLGAVIGTPVATVVVATSTPTATPPAANGSATVTAVPPAPTTAFTVAAPLSPASPVCDTFGDGTLGAWVTDYGASAAWGATPAHNTLSCAGAAAQTNPGAMQLVGNGASGVQLHRAMTGLTAQTPYTLTMWVYDPTTNGTNIHLYVTGYAGATSSTGPTGGYPQGWTQVNIPFSTGNSNTSAQANIYLYSGTLALDDIYLQQGATGAAPATAVPSFTPVPAGGINDPGFENNGSFTPYWQTQANTTLAVGGQAHTGTGSAYFTAAGDQVFQTVSGLSAGHTYSVAAYLKANTAGQHVCVGARDYAPYGGIVSTCTTGTTYAPITTTFSLVGSQTSAVVFAGMTTNNEYGGGYADDFSLTDLGVAATPTPHPTITVPTPAPTVLPGTAPYGLHAAGKAIVDHGGTAIVLRGADKSSLEYACTFGQYDTGGTDNASIEQMRLWHINVVRVPLNEGCWLGVGGLPTGSVTTTSYRQSVRDYVTRLNNHGIAVVLDLHWSAPSVVTTTAGITETPQANMQQVMADRDNSPAFWSSVAATFASNTSVLFDLYNEPQGPSGTWNWACWRDGGCAVRSYRSNGGSNTSSYTGDYTVAGMQELLTAVRQAGATNLVLMGGLQYATDLYQWQSYVPYDPLPTPNVGASLHFYKNGYSPEGAGCVGGTTTVAQDMACLTTQLKAVDYAYPVVATEYGEGDCLSTWDNTFLPTVDARGEAGAIAWAWNTDQGCGGPGIVSNYTTGAPTGGGQGIHDYYVANAALPSFYAPNHRDHSRPIPPRGRR